MISEPAAHPFLGYLVSQASNACFDGPSAHQPRVVLDLERLRHVAGFGAEDTLQARNTVLHDQCAVRAVQAQERDEFVTESVYDGRAGSDCGAVDIFQAEHHWIVVHAE